MNRALKSEWIKIRTARANIVLASIAIGLPLLIGIPIAIFANLEGNPDEAYPNTVLGPATICVLLCGVLGVLCIGQEYRHSTIRTTFAAMPRRSTVMLAKVVLTALMGVGLGLISVAIGSVATSIIFAQRNIESSILDPGENLTATIGLVSFCGLFALCGLGIGAVLRQPAGAIPTLLLWPLLVENLVGGVLSIWFDGVIKYLPFSTGFSMAATGGNAGFDAFSRPVAGLYVSAWTVLIISIGWSLVERRDA